MRSSASTVLLDKTTPEVYAKNPFRLLGLAVLSGPREVVKRIDELKLAAEFGIAQADWSFGPQQALTGEQIREAGQELKEPAERLIWEIFWFWPEVFPRDDEAEQDPALGHLSRGETQPAVALWQQGATQGSIVAVHNLAVYNHMLALEADAREQVAEEELVELWFTALRLWEKACGDDGYWSRIQERVARMGDARVTELTVKQIRATWSEALARICASLALDRAKAGLLNRASLHAALVTHIHGDSADARRALEECASPITRRLDARILEFRNRLVRTGSLGIVENWSFVRQCQEDLSLIALLCGRTSDYFVEISDGFADVVLDGVVAYQRSTQDDCSCLALLTHLMDVEALPELRARSRETFDAVYGNALVRLARPEAGTADQSPLAASDDVRACTLISACLIAPLEGLGLSAQSRQAYAARVAGILRNLAFAAGMERDDMAVAGQMFELALGLPLGEEIRASIESERVHLQRDFEARREKELQVETEGARLIINRHGICFNDQWVTTVEVSGLRHGYVAGPEGETGSHVIAWRSYSGAEYEINASNLLPPSAYVEEHYNRILESVYYFIVPGLVERIAADIRSGREVKLGATPLLSTGMPLPVPAVLFWLKDEPISYLKLQTSIEGGRLIVSSRDNPRLSETHDVALEWNAAVFGYVVEALTRE